MDITDTCCEHINTKVSDHLTFIRISTFTFTDNSVFFSTDRSYFSFDRHSFFSTNSNQFFCLCHILFDWIFRSIEHD